MKYLGIPYIVAYSPQISKNVIYPHIVSILSTKTRNVCYMFQPDVLHAVSVVDHRDWREYHGVPKRSLFWMASSDLKKFGFLSPTSTLKA